MRLRHRVLHWAFARLKRHAWQHTRVVSRGGGGDSTISLPDQSPEDNGIRMPTLSRVDAEADVEARSALWGAVCEAAEQLATRCTVYSTRIPTPTGLARIGQPIPEVQVWQLVEALSLLTILLRADEVESQEILNVFGKTGPLALREDGLGRYLWAQHGFQGEQSALGGRPDLVVTSSSALPSAANALRIVEAKCRKQLDTQVVRAEFGKAYDLRVAMYFIWTFYSPSARVVEGARDQSTDYILAWKYVGYVIGVCDATESDYDLPANLTGRQVTYVVAKYLKEHPEKWSQPAPSCDRRYGRRFRRRGDMRLKDRRSFRSDSWVQVDRGLTHGCTRPRLWVSRRSLSQST